MQTGVFLGLYLLHASDGHSPLHASVLPLFGQLIVDLPCAEDQSFHLLWTLQRWTSFWDQPLEVSSYRGEKMTKKKKNNNKETQTL